MLERLFHLRQGESNRVAVAFSILLLEVGAYTVVKAVRDALFLSRFQVRDLSFIAIGLALLAGLAVALYLRATAGRPRNRVLALTNIVVVSTLFAIWLGLQANASAGWLAWVLYIWSRLFGVFIVMQFWLLAGDLFDLREAKRLFGLVGAGAIMGGLIGGALSQWLATVVGTPALLLVAGGMLLLAAALVQTVSQQRPEEVRALPRAPNRPSSSEHAETPHQSLLSLLTKPSYVRLVGIVLLLATMATTLLDWQLKAVAKTEFAGRTDEMAAFFGSLFFYISAFSLLMQVLGTGWVLRRFGVRVGARALPVGLGLASVVVLAHGVLPFTLLGALAGAKVAEGGLRFALDKASIELIWLPVPREVRESGKVFVDTVVDRLGTGLTGVAWLVFAAVGLDQPRAVYLIGFAVLLLSAGWLLAVQRMHRAYLDAFRESLTRRTLDLSHFRLGLGAAEAKRTLEQALQSPVAGEVRFALYLLDSWEGRLPDLSHALEHADPTVRIEALRLLSERGDVAHREAAAASLNHDDPELQVAALTYLRETSPGEADPIAESLAEGEQSNPFVRSLLLLDRPGTSERARAVIEDALQSTTGEARIAKVRLLGAASPRSAAQLLRPLLRDADPRTVEASLRAAGKARAGGLVPLLAEMLHDRRWRPRALTVLRDIGRPALVQLRSLISDAEEPVEVRRAAVRLAGAVGGGGVAIELSALLSSGPPELGREALRALARLRARHQIQVDREHIHEIALSETLHIHRDLAFLGRGSWPLATSARPQERLLERAVREDANSRLTRVFRLLGLLYAQRDMMDAARGIRSPMKATRIRSVEFLDNMLDAELKRTLLPALEDAGSARLAVTVRRSVPIREESRQQAVARMMVGPERWLGAVATQTAGTESMIELTPSIEAISQSGDSELAAVARRALDRLAGALTEEPTMGLTVVEKALKLQAVDVLSRASSEDLAFVAQIAEELELPTGALVYSHGDTPDALYVVISGEVRLHRGDEEIGFIGVGEAFGSWALFDEAPRVASATTTQDTTMLKVDRDEFLELLADRADIVQAVFRAMVERIRNLATLAGGI